MTALVERPLDAESIAALYGLLRQPTLASQFEMLARPRGVEDELAGPFLDRDGARVAYLEGEAVGFRMSVVLPGATGRWAMVWLGVAERRRRAGIGSALLAGALARLGALPGAARPPEEICLASWLPNEPALAFAARHGFRRSRTYWLMERPLGAPPTPRWPAGVEVRVYDGSAETLADYHAVYNESFARHYHFVPTTLEDTRAQTAQGHFLPAGVLLAYRNGRCAGFVRSMLLPQRGEVGVVGVIPEARGVGLGRALVRASARWLEEHGAPRVTLQVDGENENALGLYRQEGFAVARTREFWSRPSA
jgi:mycothiol synthase